MQENLGTTPKERAGLASFRLDRWRVGHRLIALVVAIALPLNLLIIAVIASLASSSIELQRTTLLYTARSLASGVDAQLAKYIAVAADLQKSSALFADDRKAFESEARQALSGVPDAWVALSDVSGQQLVNTSSGATHPLPSRGAEALAAQARAIKTRSVIITGVRRGTMLPDWVATVEAPVFKNGEPFRVITVAIRLPAFLTVLGQLDKPNPWVVGIIDGDGRFVARLPDNDKRVGQLASEGWRNVRQQEGIAEFRAIDDEWIVNANALSRLSDWTIGIGMQKSELTGAAWRAVRWSAILGAMISLSSLLLAAQVARSISRPISILQNNAVALVHGAPMQYRPDTPEIRELWDSLSHAVDDRNRADLELKRLTARMTAIVSSSYDAIVTKTLDGTITSWNESAERMFGYSEKEIIGQSVRRLIPPDRQHEEDEIIAHLLKGEMINSLETVRLTKDGRLIDVSVTISPIRDGRGKLIGASKAARDISQRKERERRLRESEERLSQIINTVNAFAGLLDASGKIIEVNARALEAAGVAREDVVGRLMADAPWWSYSSEASKRISDIVARCLGGETVRCDLEYSVRGEMRWVDFQAAPIFAADGSVVAVVPSGVDITDRKRSEEQVRLLMLEVNHRAKNMLGVVLAIARQTTSSSPRDFLGKLTQRIQALSVNLDLLVKNEWQGVDLAPLVHAQLAYISDSIGTRIAIEGPELRLNREAAQGIGMALHELATNAIKHGALSNEHGRIMVAWTCDNDDVFSIYWQEHDGPAVEPPTRRGFGNTVLTTLAEAAVSGHVAVEYNPTGLRWELTCSARNALEHGRASIRTHAPRPSAMTARVSRQ
jgi:PAS domain S-box-containing protein